MTTGMYRKATLAAALGLFLASQAYAAPHELTIFAVVDQQTLTVQAAFWTPGAPVPQDVLESNFFDVSRTLFQSGWRLTYSESPVQSQVDVSLSTPHPIRISGSGSASLTGYVTTLGGDHVNIRDFFIEVPEDPTAPLLEAMIFGVLNPSHQSPEFVVEAVVTSEGALLPKDVAVGADFPEVTRILVGFGYSLNAQTGNVTFGNGRRSNTPTGDTVIVNPRNGAIKISRSLFRRSDLNEVVLIGGVDLNKSNILTEAALTGTDVLLPQLTGRFLDDTRVLIDSAFVRYATLPVADDADEAPPRRIRSGSPFHVLITATGEIGIVRSFFHPGIEAPTEPTEPAN